MEVIKSFLIENGASLIAGLVTALILFGFDKLTDRFRHLFSNRKDVEVILKGEHGSVKLKGADQLNEENIKKAIEQLQVHQKAS